MQSQPPSPEPVPTPATRRQFLTRTAALAGAAAAGHALTACASTVKQELAIPKSVAGAPLAAGQRIKIGVIGCGGMGNGHLDGLLVTRESGAEALDIVALCDVNKVRLDKAHDKCASKQKIDVGTYRSYQDVLAREDVHAVLIASPEHWHAKMAEDAIAAGKDVYLEKPMTLRLEDALRLRRVVQANDRILQVGTQYMLKPKYAEARKLIQSGAIGAPTLAQASYCRNSKDGEWLYEIDKELEPGPLLDWDGFCGPLGKRPWDTEIYHRWRRYKDFSTGIVGDLLVHEMTPMMWALDSGWPVRVTAHGSHRVDKAMENHDQVFMTVTYQSGVTMIVAGSTCNEAGLETLIRGHQANLYMASSDVVLRPERVFADDVDEQQIKCVEGDTQDRLRMDWLSSVRTRKPNASPVEFGTQMMVIVALATRSMWEKRSFEFDPAAMRVVQA